MMDKREEAFPINFFHRTDAIWERPGASTFVIPLIPAGIGQSCHICPVIAELYWIQASCNSHVVQCHVHV